MKHPSPQLSTPPDWLWSHFPCCKFEAKVLLCLNLGLSQHFWRTAYCQSTPESWPPTRTGDWSEHDILPSEMSSDLKVARKGPKECLATGLTHLEVSATSASIRSRKTPARVSGSAPAQSKLHHVLARTLFIALCHAAFCVSGNASSEIHHSLCLRMLPWCCQL